MKRNLRSVIKYLVAMYVVATSISFLSDFLLFYILKERFDNIMNGETPKYGGDPKAGKSTFSPLIPILMPICGRFNFLNETVESLNNVADIEKTVLIVSDDCWAKFDVDSTNILSGLRLPVLTVKHSKPYFGIPSYILGNSEYATSANIYFLLEFAFNTLNVPAAIVLESDLVPTRDFFRYFLWNYEFFYNNNDDRNNVKTSNNKLTTSNNNEFDGNHIFSISGYQHYTENQIKEMNVAGMGEFMLETCVFVGWSWMTSKNMWLKSIKPNWTWFGSWDLVLEATRKSLNLSCICPVQSRVKNIGYEGENFKMTAESYKESKFNNVYLEKDTVRSYFLEDDLQSSPIVKTIPTIIVKRFLSSKA